MLYNIRDQKWDKELLQIMDIPESMLPEVKESSEFYGETDYNIFSKKFRLQESQVISMQLYLDKCALKKEW